MEDYFSARGTETQLLREDFEQKKLKENELFLDRINVKTKEIEKLTEQKLRKQLSDEQSEKFELLNNELNEV